MREALLLMDFQKYPVSAVPGSAAAVVAARTALAAARAHAVPVLHVRVAFRSGHPEIPATIHAFDGLLGTDVFTDANPGTAFEIEPGDGEVVVSKHFYSGFTHSDLDILLRAAGVEKVTMAGLATSGVVLSTVRDALERGYRTTVLSDACADPDPEVHRVLMDKVIAPNADVITVQQWADSLIAPG
jgi:nicotinamidase-related amidase